MSKRLNLPKLEEQIQEYWSQKAIFNEVCESKKGNKKFYFCQGPPFTSGKAHIGHAWNHSIKDAVLRYKTMCGFDVFRRAGWDMHGLPIEVKVEETVLGSRTKKEIEEYGIENFITECKKFAIRNMNQMTEQLRRLGIWLDWDDPYMTIDKRYMEGVWFLIKRAHEENLLYEAERVIHWCPRCETALSGYEVRDEYRDITDPSIYVKAKLRDEDAYIVIWTTTPWTLPANTGIAVHPDSVYVKVRTEKETLIIAKERLDILKNKYEVIESFKGRELEGKRYHPMLDIPIQKKVNHRVVTAPDLVTMEEGTGCVHIAPGHGEEDFRVGKEHNLDLLSPVDDSGRFTIKPYKGSYIRDCNSIIIKTLKDKGNLLLAEKKTHSYPHCWRCKTPLILRTTKQWFLAISKIRNKLIDKNKEIRWVPQWIGSKRFENWLRNARDWCISRQRYWNTPLPIWRCGCGKIKVVGTIDELIKDSVQTLDFDTLDLHRPYIDKIKLRCECGGEMDRVSHVMDVWLDSGSASWSNLGYPHEKEKFGELFPADFITEGSDQTRGWFYSLLASSIIAFDKIPYERVLYHGFILDEEGKKMSKSLGNVVDPSDIVDEYGADVLRFYMLWATVPWEDLRFSADGLETINRMCNIFWNTYLFTDTYMKLDDFDPKREYEIELRVEDRWIISRYNSLILNVDENMGNLHLHEVCHLLQDFILELSRWYIKLVRDRVWLEGEKPEKISVYTTLHEVLCGLCRLMAPVMPHLSEDIYVNLTGERSVHLNGWPTPDKDLIDKNLEDCMETAQQIVEGVASARQTAAIKLRWPIPKIIVAPTEELNLEEVEDIILKAGNAKSLQIKKMETETTVRPNYSCLGPKYRGEVEAIAGKLKTVDAEKIRREIEEKGSYTLGKFTLCDDDLIFETRLPQDIVAQEFDKGIIYIDSKLDEKLLSEAMAREVIRRIQEMRKDLQLNEMDKIKVYVDCDSGFKGYIKENMEFIGHEIRGRIFFGKGRGFEREWKIEDNKINIAVELAAGSSE